VKILPLKTSGIGENGRTAKTKSSMVFAARSLSPLFATFAGRNVLRRRRNEPLGAKLPDIVLTSPLGLLLNVTSWYTWSRWKRNAWVSTCCQQRRVQ